MKHVVLFVGLVLLLLPATAAAQAYVGFQNCDLCHSTKVNQWKTTLHSKIHLVPDTTTMRTVPSFTVGDSVNMGSSYGNAKVYLSRVGNEFFARLGSGGPTYKIVWTYGYGYKQRYLVKIDTSYYMLPVQWNMKSYLDNSTGSWVSYSPATWFNSNGTLKATNANSFRAKSWDKNCMGCHVTGGKVDMVVVGSDTSWKATWANNSDAGNIVIGCESCHGPKTGIAGLGHQMNPKKLTSKDAKLEVCGQCHNRASSQPVGGVGIGTHEFPKDEGAGTYFNPADTTKPLAQFLKLTNPPNASGGPGTWPDLVTARSHHQQYQELLGSKHYDNPFVEITCFTCHFSHGTSPNRKNIVDSITVSSVRVKVANEDNTLCLSCHATHGPFANIPLSWIQNEPAKRDSIGMVVNQHTRHSVYDPLNQLNSGGIGRCSQCHMTHTATTARSYDIATHTFAVVPPIKTRLEQATVLAGQKGSINSCAAACHRNGSTSVAGSIIPDWGIADASLTDWSEGSDVQMADTLWAYWQAWGFTGVKEVEGTVPAAFALSQNYPNPFNPSTRILVEVGTRGQVQLAVYDVAGRLVATLMDGQYESGRYEVTWAGKNNAGLQAASGVYLYRLEGPGVSLTKKMLMLK